MKRWLVAKISTSSGPLRAKIYRNGHRLKLYGTSSEFSRQQSFIVHSRKHVLFNQLQRRRAQNESPVILTIQPGMPRSTYEKICQIFFERFNVAGFAVVERPMAQIYAGNSLSGVVVDIGYNTTDITPIYEGFILHSARSHTDVGIRHCEIYLANLLRSNTSVMSVLSPPEAMLSPEDLQQTLLDFSKYIWSAGYVKVPSSGETAIVEDEGVTDIAAVLVAGKEKAVIESGMKKKANAKASAAEQARAREIEALDLVTIQFRDKSITLGKERHRFCEPLFDPMLLATIPPSDVDVPLSYADTRPIQEATGHAVSLADIDQRLYIWQGLFVTGDLTKNIKGEYFLLYLQLILNLYRYRCRIAISACSIYQQS